MPFHLGDNQSGRFHLLCHYGRRRDIPLGERTMAGRSGSPEELLGDGNALPLFFTAYNDREFFLVS